MNNDHLLIIVTHHDHYSRLKSTYYVLSFSGFLAALEDDYEGVRSIALNLIHVLAMANPDEVIKIKDTSTCRLVDDAFGKICSGVNDLR